MKRTTAPLSVLIILLILLAAGLGFAHGWRAPEEAEGKQNPVVPDEDSLWSGQMAYQNYCTVCHGESLEGKKALETGLGMDTPNLKEGLKSHSDGDFFWKIREGRGEMPAYKDILSDEQTWQIINYIRKTSE